MISLEVAEQETSIELLNNQSIFEAYVRQLIVKMQSYNESKSVEDSSQYYQDFLAEIRESYVLLEQVIHHIRTESEIQKILDDIETSCLTTDEMSE